MKKRFTILLSLFALLFSTSSAQVIFDPGVYPAESLPAGMSIVSIEGKSYLKVALNAWSTSITMAEDITIAPGHTRLKAMVKYETGTSGFAMENVNTFLKLANADWADVVAEGQGSSAEFVEYIIDDVPEGAVVHAFQMAGQETTGWSAVTGDTLYIGRVIVEDPMAYLDPVVVHPDNLPDGWTLDEIDGNMYFKVALNGWSSYWAFLNNIGTITIGEKVTAIKTMAKYATGTSGYAIEDVNTWMKFSDPEGTELTANGVGSNAEFTKFNLEVEPSSILGSFQVAGQETSGWSAVTGDTMWIGVFMADMVESVAIDAGGGTAIDEPDGELQLTAVVTPDDAYNTDVSWESSDEDIATVSNGGTVSAVEDGTVTITITAQDGSEATASVEIIVSNQHLGISNAKNELISVYPNPLKNTLYIENASNVSNISIFDISGKIVVNIDSPEKIQSIDLSDLNEGVYILRATQDKKVQTIKLVK